MMAVLIACSLTGCSARLSRLKGGLEVSIPPLAERLSALSPFVRRDEALQVARIAMGHSIELAQSYRIVRPPLLHNALVNLGLKRRGLCHHWTTDLFAELQRHEFATLEVSWGLARAGTMREHNAIVITARGDTFENGIVLDAWRCSGHVYWCEVAKDNYPWEEGETTSTTASPR
jgi:hypothetical protein